MHKVPIVHRYSSDSKKYEWGFVADKAGFGRLILFRTSLGNGDTRPDMPRKFYRSILFKASLVNGDTRPDMSRKSAHEMIGLGA